MFKWCDRLSNTKKKNNKALIIAPKRINILLKKLNTTTIINTTRYSFDYLFLVYFVQR